MDMQIEFKKKRKDSLDNRYTFCISNSLKVRLEHVKDAYPVDINEMIRNFVENVVTKLEQGQINQD